MTSKKQVKKQTTREKALQIYHLYFNTGVKRPELAELFNVSYATVHRIVHNRWKNMHHKVSNIAAVYRELSATELKDIATYCRRLMEEHRLAQARKAKQPFLPQQIATADLACTAPTTELFPKTTENRQERNTDVVPARKLLHFSHPADFGESTEQRYYNRNDVERMLIHLFCKLNCLADRTTAYQEACDIINVYDQACKGDI